MKLPRRRQFLHLAVGAAALSAVPQIAWAQVYPSRPITVVVPFAPGGATDVIARSLAERMRITLGQSIIVENVTGAGGAVGVGRAVRSAPDGYTLSIGQWTTHVANEGGTIEELRALSRHISKLSSNGLLRKPTAPGGRSDSLTKASSSQ